MIGPGMTRSATAAGRVSAAANSIERFWLWCAASVAAGAERPGELGQEHDADGDADDAERQLVEAVGIVEPGDGAGLQRGDDRADDDVDLDDAAGDDARAGELGQPLDAVGPARPAELHA